MIISGIGYQNLAMGETRAVEKTVGTSAQSSYYQDENPERTRNSDFARALAKATAEVNERSGKIERFRKSEDYEELQKMQPKETPSWVEALTHVSSWEAMRARPQDLLARTGW